LTNRYSIWLKNIYKSFGKSEVIHGISCDIQDGEFIVILGPSGCGKSTVLRMIAGLEVITGGEIEINGDVVNQLEPADRDIAMVFQNYALYPHMTVYKNMAYGLKIRRMPKAEIDERVRNAATFQLKVDHVELLGADTLVHGHFSETKTLLTFRLADIQDFKRNTILPIVVPPQKTHLFDKETGNRIDDILFTR
jgi:ABC-type sugar transport system ATPase subunit